MANYVESDDEEFNLGNEFSHVENTQLKKKRKTPQDMGDKLAKGKENVGTATTMSKILEQLLQAIKRHNKAEKVEIAAASYVHGQYSIPECIKVLISLEEEGVLSDQQFTYALELIKDCQNTVILMCLKDSSYALGNWIRYKYDLKS